MAKKEDKPADKAPAKSRSKAASPNQPKGGQNPKRNNRR